MGGFLLKSHRSAKLLNPNRFAKLIEIEVLLSLYLPNIKSAWPIIFFCSICPLILGVKFSAQKCVKIHKSVRFNFSLFHSILSYGKSNEFFFFWRRKSPKRGIDRFLNRPPHRPRAPAIFTKAVVPCPSISTIAFSGD